MCKRVGTADLRLRGQRELECFAAAPGRENRIPGDSHCPSIVRRSVGAFEADTCGNIHDILDGDARVDRYGPVPFVTGLILIDGLAGPETVTVTPPPAAAQSASGSTISFCAPNRPSPSGNVIFLCAFLKSN